MAMTGSDKSIGQLLGDLSRDTSSLIRNEVELAKTEMGEKVNQVGMALVSLVAGFLIGFAALIILLDAVVYGLSQHMPLWVAAVIVGVVVAIVGFLLVKKGQTDLKASNLAPRRTMESIRRDGQFVKEQVK